MLKSRFNSPIYNAANALKSKWLWLVAVVMISATSNAQLRGYNWTFSDSSNTTFKSTPAVAGSTDTLELNKIGDGYFSNTPLSDNVALGTGYTGPILVRPFIKSVGLEFLNSPPRVITNAYTIEMVINLSDDNIYRRLIGFRDLSGLEGDNGIYVSETGAIDFYNGASHFLSASPLAVNTWYHLVFTRNASNVISFYLNGVLIGTYTDNLNDFIPNADGYYIVSFLKDNTGDETSGKIARIGMYNEALSLTAIQESFNNIGSTGVLADSWKTNGNTGTTASSFIGTRDNQPLIFKTNNTEVSRVTSSGNVGIGTTDPLYKLDINGTLRIGSLSADPAGAAGVLYYNSASNRYRGNLNGAWKSFLMEGDSSIKFTNLPFTDTTQQILGINTDGSLVRSTKFVLDTTNMLATRPWVTSMISNSVPVTVNVDVENGSTYTGSLGAISSWSSNFFGIDAGNGATGASNANFFGQKTGENATNASDANFFGYNAGGGASGAWLSNFFGSRAGYGATNAKNSNFLGNVAGYQATSASNSNFFGNAAGYKADSASNSIFMGENAGQESGLSYPNKTNNGANDYSILLGRYTRTGGKKNSILLGGSTNTTYISNTSDNQFMLAPNITKLRFKDFDYDLAADTLATRAYARSVGGVPVYDSYNTNDTLTANRWVEMGQNYELRFKRTGTTNPSSYFGISPYMFYSYLQYGATAKTSLIGNKMGANDADNEAFITASGTTGSATFDALGTGVATVQATNGIDMTGNVNIAGNTTITGDLSTGGVIMRDGVGSLLHIGSSGGADESSYPALNGNIYYDELTGKFRAYENGTWVDMISTSGSNKALSNLASVAINTSLISDADNTDDLGSAAIGWKDVYARTLKLDGSTSGTTTLQASAAAGSNIITFPSTTGTVPLGSTVNTFTASNTFSGGLFSTGGFHTQSSAANSNFSVPTGNTAATLTQAELQAEGSTSIGLRALMRGSTNYSIPAGFAHANFNMGKMASTEAASGTHPLIAGMVLRAPIITNGAASTTNTTTLYIDGEPTGITPTGTSSSLWIASGKLRLGKAGTALGSMLFEGNTSGVVTVKPAAAAGTWTLTLPTAYPAANGYVLSANTDGTSSWISQSVGLNVDVANGSTYTGSLGSPMIPYSNFIGFNAGTGAIDAENSNFFGFNAGNGASYASGSNFFGVWAGSGATEANYSNFLGGGAGSQATSAANSNFFGTSAGSGASVAYNSNFFGQQAGLNSTYGYNSNFFGTQAGEGASEAYNSNFFGQQAGLNSTYASHSNFFGNNAGMSATNAKNSIFFGQNAGNESELSTGKTNNGTNDYSILLGHYTRTGGFKNSILLGGAINTTYINNTADNQFMLAPNINKLRFNSFDYDLAADTLATRAYARSLSTTGNGVVFINGNYTVHDTASYIYANRYSTAGAMQITMPNPSLYKGRIIRVAVDNISKVDANFSGINGPIFYGDGAYNGITALSNVAVGTQATLVSNGTNWVVAQRSSVNTVVNVPSGTGETLVRGPIQWGSNSVNNYGIKRIKAGTGITLSSDINEITINATGDSATTIFSNGLTKTDSTVKLGGVLQGFTNIQTGPHTFVAGTNDNYLSISPSASNLISGDSITGTSAGISSNGTTTSLLGEIRLSNYPLTRDDGNTTKALYVDSTGNLKYGSLVTNAPASTDSTKWSSDSINVFNKNIGNVGIGTMAPTAKFHTLGSLRFESFKNNEQGDSVLTTDTDGNLKMVYLPYGSSGGGGGGASYTFENGVAQSNGHVSLGGSLLDSVKLNLNGHPFNFNSGTNRVLSFTPNGSFNNGTANYDLTANSSKFNIGSKQDSVGYGSQLSFNGLGNSDGLWMSRFNASNDASEIRVNLGDDGGSADKFHIGYQSSGGTWKSNFVVQANGQAGIGTSEVNGDLSVGMQHGDKLSIGNNSWANKTIITTGTDVQNGDFTELKVPGSQANSAYLRLNKEGSVGIGTTKTDAGYKLLVNGRVKAVGMRVQAAANWPDYVFDSVYQLRPLAEVEKFIKTNKHLPEFPKAAQVEKEGHDVSEIQIKLLQKIEELTLYIIDQDKRVKELEEKNKKLDDQNKQIVQMQEQLAELKKLILTSK